MNNKFFFLLVFFIFLEQTVFSQTKFKNPDGNIEYLEFRNEGMYLKLTLTGIKYAKKYNGRKEVAKKVLNLHNKMTKGTSEFKLECIMARIFYHVKAYSLKNPKWILNKSARIINTKYYELIWDQCDAPTDLID